MSTPRPKNTQTAQKNPAAQAKQETRRFSWDGISFDAPSHWNLSTYSQDRAVRRIEMEDDDSHRLEAEWFQSKTSLNPTVIEQRYLKFAKKLVKSTRESISLKHLPEGWAAFIYSFSDGRKLVTAWLLLPKKNFFIFFSLHFETSSKESPEDCLERLTQSFKLNEDPVIPWECYDLHFKIPSVFKLKQTEFLAGRKKFSFTWRGRHLYIWYFSLADLLLKKRTLSEWAAEFLSGQPGLRGPKYFVEAEEIRTRRRTWRFVHMDQLSTLCFRYQCGVIHMPIDNRICLWAFHFRRQCDSEHLKGFAPV